MLTISTITTTITTAAATITMEVAGVGITTALLELQGFISIAVNLAALGVEADVAKPNFVQLLTIPLYLFVLDG